MTITVTTASRVRPRHVATAEKVDAIEIVDVAGNGTIAAVRGGVATVAARGDPLEAVVVVVVLLEAKVMVVVAHHVVRLKVQKEIQSVPQAVRENLPTPMCGTNW
eukprot:symbB.v1.2.029285.t2/scaffold3188.1/size61668/3